MPTPPRKRTPEELRRLQVDLIRQTLERIEQQMDDDDLDAMGLAGLIESVGRSMNTTVDLLEVWEQAEPEAREEILDRILRDLRGVMTDDEPPHSLPREQRPSPLQPIPNPSV